MQKTAYSGIDFIFCLGDCLSKRKIKISEMLVILMKIKYYKLVKKHIV